MRRVADRRAPPADAGARAARLLDPAALARYDGLALAVRRGMGERPGDRRFPGHPQPAGTELEAYSAYAPGDDLRHLDWNAVGRLDQLLVRRYTAEREVLFHVLVDCSASMGAAPADGKLAAALELAMAFAYMALASTDAVRVALLGGTGPARVSPVYRQRASVEPVARFLAAATPAGGLDLAAALARYAREQPRAGTALLISDFMMEPAAVERGIEALKARRFEVVLLQILGRSELEPERAWRQAVLEDAESGARHPMALTAATRARYQRLLQGHLDALGTLADRAQAAYATTTSDTPTATLVTALAARGVLRRR